MGKTYHRQKPADIDRSHALKPEKTKVRLNPRDIFSALDESAEETRNMIPNDYEPGGYEPYPMMEDESDDPYVYEPGGYEPYPMMPGESDDPYVYVPGIGGRTMGGVLPFSQGRGRSVTG